MSLRTPYARSYSNFQREEVEAAERTTPETALPDLRGVAAATEAAHRLVAEFAGIDDWESFRGEVTIVVPPGELVAAARFLRDELGFALLSDISPVDWLGTETPRRFAVSYICTKLTAGAPRLRLRVWVDEGQAIPSLIEVWPTADWHEREAWDFFGIEFSGRAGLRRLLMDDDWVGHPMRKDYPIGGEPVKFTNSLREI